MILFFDATKLTKYSGLLKTSRIDKVPSWPSLRYFTDSGESDHYVAAIKAKILASTRA